MIKWIRTRRLSVKNSFSSGFKCSAKDLFLLMQVVGLEGHSVAANFTDSGTLNAQAATLILFFFFITLSLELRDTNVYDP